MIQPRQSIQSLVRISEKEPSRLFQYRMDRNERTHPFGEYFMKCLKKELTDEMLMTYPEPEPLYDKFSEWLGLQREQILFHSGSDLAIKAVFETYINPNDKILLHLPGYAMYKIYADMFQAQIDFLEYDSDLQFDMGRFIDMVTEKHRMVVVENPNGFVGNKHSTGELRALVRKAHRLGVLVLVDEAYFHFIQETAASFLGSFDNLIVVRTFSKAFGLAGLRAAYLLSLPGNIKYLYRVKPMHELNSMAIFVISALLKHEDEVRRFIRETKESLNYLKISLNALGISVSDSCANFLAARFGTFFDCVDLARHLKKFNFLIRRPFREEHLREWSRIGTLPLALEKLMIEELRKYIEAHSHKKHEL